MKNLLLFILTISLSFATYAQDESNYKWLVGANTGAVYASSDASSVGNIQVSALYSVTDNLMVGGVLGVNFGDAEGEDIQLAARYYFSDLFAAASYDLGDSDTGVSVGLGYGWDVADNVEFSPQLSYNPDFEIIAFQIGFAIRF